MGVVRGCPIKKMIQEEKNISVKATQRGKKMCKFYMEMLLDPSLVQSS